MEILLVTAELSPYASSGPAGDCVAALSGSLCQLGHAVTVLMPRVAAFEEAGLMIARRLSPLALGAEDVATVYDAQLPSGAKLVLFDAPNFELRAAVLEENGKPYPDAAERAAALCRTAHAFARQQAEKGSGFDVIHLHGWAPAAAAAGAALPSMVTFYDPAQQGVVTEKEFAGFGLEDAEAQAGFRYGEGYNLLAGGMLAADAVTTLSQHLAEQARTVDFVGAVGAALTERGTEIIAIPPGLDYAVHNPATDTAIAARYDAESSHMKRSCKAHLCQELELDPDAELPLAVFAQELSTDTGADLLVAVALQLCKGPLQLVVAGTGNARLQQRFGAARLSRLVNFRFIPKLSSELQRRLVAAADLALCPNRVAPLGLPLRVAQRYGAVPVALSNPVALDCIVDCPPDLSSGTGFLFDEPSSDGLMAGVERALAASRDDSFPSLRRRIMRLDLGWERAARRYAQLYKSLTSSTHPLRS